MKRKVLIMLLALCLIVGLLPVTALAASEVATLSYAEIGDFHASPVSVTLKEGDAAKYFLTETGVDADWPLVSFLVADGASADNYNVKFEYAAGGVPTIYLKGAVITSDYGLTLGTVNDTFDAKLVIESDSTIGKTHSDAYRDHCVNFMTSGDVTITGAGKLTIHGSGRLNVSEGYILTHGNLLIQDASIDLIEAPKYGENQAYYGASAIMAEGGDLTIDHSNIYADYNGSKKSVTNLFVATDVEGKGGNITIKNLSNIEMWSAGTKTSGCNMFNIPVDEDLTDDKTWLITIENSNVEVGMTYHASGAYSIFNVGSQQVALKDTDEAYAQVPDSAGEIWCDDLRDYDPEYEDEEEPMYLPLTVIRYPDEDGFIIKATVEATLENGALVEYRDVEEKMHPKLKYFKLTHVCIGEGVGSICSSCGAEITNVPDATTPEEDGTLDDFDMPTIPTPTTPADDNGQEAKGGNTVLYVVLAVVAVAVIAAIVVIVVLKKKNKKEDSAEE